jgi:hypothetical protein
MRNKNSDRYRNETEEQLAHRREINRRSYNKHKEKYAKLALLDKENQNEHKVQWARNNPEKYLWNLAKKRANKKGLDFNIDYTDIIIPEFCPILNEKLSQVKQSRDNQALSPSLDRIDNSKGYIKGNVRVISYTANIWKKTASIDHAENLVLYMRGLI